MPALRRRRRTTAAQPAPAPERRYQLGVDVISIRMAESRERQAAEAARAQVAAQTARAMAAAVVGKARCSLTVEDVLPVCELADAVVRLAAAKGVYVEHPRLDEIVKVCEDLATRNRRRGYSALVPIGPLSACLFGGYTRSGADFGYTDGEGQWLRAVSHALPSDHPERLHTLQHPGDDRARALLAELDAAGVERYQS